MQQQVDLGMVLGNTLTNLSWTGFTFVCAIVLIGLLWCVLPFAVFGVKRRLDAIEAAQRQQTELLITELRRTNELLARRATAAPAAEAWHAPRVRTQAETAPVAVEDGILAQLNGAAASGPQRDDRPRPLARPFLRGSAA